MPSRSTRSARSRRSVRSPGLTGSTVVGKQLAALAGLHMKRVTMELGGHAPVIVFDDADAAVAAKAMAASKFRNAGQVCISPTRFYVQEDSYKKFLARFTEYAKGVKLGDGLEKGITMGPLANSRRVDAMESIMADVKQRGGKVATGGKRPSNQGFFYEPTVVTDVPDDSKIMTQEPFGPIAALAPFTEIDDAVARANGTAYAFAAYLFTDSARTRDRVLATIRASNIGVNQMAPAMQDASFVFEAAPEKLPLKQQLFAELECLTAPDAILASNSSAIPSTRIGEYLKHRERVIGTHFWNPPHLVPLVEVTQNEFTSSDTVQKTMTLLRDAGRRPVLGHRASRDVDVDVVFREPFRVDSEPLRVAAHPGQRRLRRLLHDVAQLAGDGHPAAAGH